MNGNKGGPVTIDQVKNEQPREQKMVFFDRVSKDLPLFLQVLLAEGTITIDELKPYLKSNKLNHITMEPFLLSKAGRDKLLQALSRSFSVPAIDLEKADISPRVGMVIPSGMGKSSLLACVSIEQNGIHLAMVDPSDDYAVDQVESYTDFKVIKRYVVLHSDLIDFQEVLYNESFILPVNPRDIVDEIIKMAIEQGASDIHIEPLEDDLRVRLRKDGMLVESYDFQEAVLKNMSHKKLVVRRLKRAVPVVIKNKSGASGKTMDNAERKKTQDGRIFIPANHIEMRVSILPSVHGESIAIRILNPEKEKSDFARLGFSALERSRFESVIRAPYGIILVSGPTGSGKTTTLYTVLSHLNDPAKKIITVEDPVEYTIPGIVQIQTNPSKGITFAEALRSFLRHDPDIIMVGEIRDKETAAMAIEASLTGHLVLSTIHANDSVRTITRMKDLGATPLLLTSTCLAAMAQRLVRVNCEHCSEKAHFSPPFFQAS
jgi:type IV pilus assembly protein PilB